MPTPRAGARRDRGRDSEQLCTRVWSSSFSLRFSGEGKLKFELRTASLSACSACIARRDFFRIAARGQVNRAARQLLGPAPLPGKGCCAGLPVERYVFIRFPTCPIKLLLHTCRVAVDKGNLVQIACENLGVSSFC